jgi:hypothetical protein
VTRNNKTGITGKVKEGKNAFEIRIVWKKSQLEQYAKDAISQKINHAINDVADKIYAQAVEEEVKRVLDAMPDRLFEKIAAKAIKEELNSGYGRIGKLFDKIMKSFIKENQVR